MRQLWSTGHRAARRYPPRIGLLCLLALLLTVQPWHGVSAVADGTPDRVTLQLKWTHQFQFAGYYVAQQQGFFREAGLNVTIVAGGPETDAVSEVVSRRADFGVGTSGLLLDRAHGKPVVVLGVVYQHSPLVLLARADRASQGLHSLVGSRIMLEPNSADLLAMLEHEQMPLNALTSVPHSGRVDDLLSGRIDAISAYVTDETYLVERAGLPSLTFTPRAYGIDFYGDNLFTREDLAQQRPEMVRRFYAAAMRGWAYAYQHQEQTIDLILEQYEAGRPREHLVYEAVRSRELVLPDLIAPGYMRRERWAHIGRTYQRLGMLNDIPALDGFLFETDEPRLPPWFWPASAVALALLAVSAALATYFGRINRRLRIEMSVRRRTQSDLLAANARLSSQLLEIGRLRDELHEQAIRDPLTGLFNRRHLLETFELVLTQARRTDQPVSVLLLDIDHFKAVNDRFGHPIGDVALRAVARLAADHVRDGDVVCRYGGEEILIVLPNVSVGMATHRAEALRCAVEALTISAGAATIQLTVSAGVAAFPRDGHDPETVIRAADQALYRAKAGGRNQTVSTDLQQHVGRGARR